jgi:hypothetical protein
MKKTLFSLALLSSAAWAAELQQESDLKFAFYSSAWGENTDDGLRLVANNQSASDVVLKEVVFLKGSTTSSDDVSVDVNLLIPAGAYADAEFDYIDLLADDECIERTMESNWRLAEISNYTLNPSVRNLIIEDTDSFRIYQCVETIITRWQVLSDSKGAESAAAESLEKEEWILFHFETRRL